VTSEVTAPPAIVASGLTKRYSGVEVVSNISFTLPAGSRTALLGHNGAGKSTLLGLLTTLLAPNEGDATIAGHSISSNPIELRRNIGVLAHLPMVYEELSPLENLQFFARLYEVPDAGARIEQLLRAIGLWRRRREPTSVLSRGYHQRLALARAIIHRPSVLLLDEPETGLDPEGVALLDQLALAAPSAGGASERQGVTVLAATHLVDRVNQWATGVLRLDRGRIVEAPPVDTTVSRPVAAHA
jgi:ABC-type multidrug transport system ATPase subunit